MCVCVSALKSTQNVPPGHLFIVILRYFVCACVSAFKSTRNVPPGHWAMLNLKRIINSYEILCVLTLLSKAMKNLETISK